MIPLSIVAPFVLLALAALPGQAAVPERLQAIFPGPAELRTVHGAADLVKLLQPADFTPAGIRDRGLPPLFVTNLPADSGGRGTRQEEALFLAIMLPHIVAVNTFIGTQRVRLLRLEKEKRTGKKLSPKDRTWLQALAKEYDLPGVDFTRLKLRVDYLPPSLGLAQAIVESAWGRSRMALEGNALFGLHLPKGSKARFIKAKKADVRVAAYDTIFAGVQAWAHNLNHTPAYRGLRTLRAAMRTDNRPVVSGATLARGLAGYSARGKAYVRNLQEIIKRHRLDQFDDPLPVFRPVRPLLVTCRLRS